MRGHEALIAMRLSGLKPRSVWLHMLPVQGWVTDWFRHPATRGDAEVALDAKDIAAMQRLDLRFLVGLEPVHIAGPNDDSTTRLADACLQAGAKRVLAAYYDLSKPEPEMLVRLEDRTKETEPCV